MSEKEAVLAAARRFYDALEDLMSGRGRQNMDEAWHHMASVTSSHPIGDWAYGWDEVAATWDVFAGIGRPDLSGSKITDLRGCVCGDLAYTTCIFHTAPIVGEFKLNCTNVLQKVDGVWKVVHHHPDKDARIGEALQRIAETD